MSDVGVSMKERARKGGRGEGEGEGEGGAFPGGAPDPQFMGGS